MKKTFYLFAVVLISAIFAGKSFAYSVPEDDSGAEFFYAFGLRGTPDEGAEHIDPQLVLIFDVPQNASEDLSIDIFDPDTGGKFDQTPSKDKTWESIFKFSVYGKKDAPLESRSLDLSPEYDAKYYRFGPFPKEMGQRVGDFYRFKLIVSPIKTFILSGRDLNLFNVRVLPEEAETFAEKFYFRLAPHEGDRMYFYPEIPANTQEVIIENFDLDPDGASAQLFDPLTKKTYEINASASAAWAETKIELTSSDKARRLQYILTKKTQAFGNAGVRVKDSAGNPLRIYFSETARKAESLQTASAPVTIQKKVIKPKQVVAKRTEPVKQTAPESAKPVVSQASIPLTVSIPRVKPAKAKAPAQKVATKQAIAITQTKAGPLQCNKFNFDGTASHDPNKEKLSFLWDFGDGTIMEGPAKVTHEYKKGGRYNVELTVDDKQNTACSKNSTNIEVIANTPPVAKAGPNFACCIDTESTFDGSSSFDADGDNLSFYWDFGDGSTGQGAKVAHTYTKGGIYTVSLKVDDNSGTECSTSAALFKVQINQSPVSVIKVR